jgi:hypothetical protein
MPQIKPQVFCHELNRLVSGEDVWELRYGKSRINQELTFKCSDPECTARFIVRNCAAHLAPWETGFRLYPRSKHRLGCNVTEQHQAQKRTSFKMKRSLFSRPFFQGPL